MRPANSLVRCQKPPLSGLRKSLILGASRESVWGFRKHLFLEQHRTLLLLQRHDRVYLCGVAGSQNKKGDRLGSPATFFCCRQFCAGGRARTGTPLVGQRAFATLRVCLFRHPGQLFLEHEAYQTLGIAHSTNSRCRSKLAPPSQTPTWPSLRWGTTGCISCAKDFL